VYATWGSQYHSSRFITVSGSYAVHKTTAKMVNCLFELSSTSQWEIHHKNIILTSLSFSVKGAAILRGSSERFA